MSNYTRKPRMARYEKKGLRRSLLTVLAVMLLVAVSVGGTIAWLTATTGSVVNTFSPSDINIELKEHDYVAADNSLDTDKEVSAEADYKMVPGKVLPKDPFVRIPLGSEPCYVFVTIDKSENADTFLSYTVGSSWQQLAEDSNVYYYVNGGTTIASVNALSAAQTLTEILQDDQVTVKSSVTKNVMKTLYNEDGTVNTAAFPTLTFKAYAIQSENLPADSTPASIWALITEE